MSISPTPGNQIPVWLRWTALVWLAFWLPVYWRTWGPANFLHLCDIAVILTCIGLWFNSTLLISSQAVASLLANTAWLIDAGSGLLLPHPLIPGTESLSDPHYPLWIRLLSLYHLAMVPLVLWAVARMGYDRRGWVLQSAIALPAFVAARFTSPADNINFAFSAPFFHRQIGPVPVHVAASWLFMVVVAYLPTHAVLKRVFRSPVPRGSIGDGPE